MFLVPVEYICKDIACPDTQMHFCERVEISLFSQAFWFLICAVFGQVF